MTDHLVLVIVGVLLLGWVLASVWIAVRRPTASPDALQRYSLTTGRLMLLAGYVGMTGAGGGVPGSGVAAVAALVVGILAEHRWPRQTGAVRVAPAVRRTLDRTVRPFHAFVLAGGALIATAALVVRWQVTGSGSTVDVGLAPLGVSTADVVASASIGSASTLLIGVILLVLAVLVAGWALRVILIRPALAGVDSAGDEVFRKIAAERVLRALAAMFLVAAYSVLDELAAALEQLSPPVTGLTDGLADALRWLDVGLIGGVVLLFLAGPNLARLRRALPATARR